MNTNELIQELTNHLLNKDAQLEAVTQQRDAVVAALNSLQAQIDAAQASATPPWSPPVLAGNNPSDLSNWQHTGQFALQSSSFEVERFDVSVWVPIGTGINNGDFCRIRSVTSGNASDWVEFSV